MQQSFNLEQTNYGIQSVKDTKTVVSITSLELNTTEPVSSSSEHWCVCRLVQAVCTNIW